MISGVAIVTVLAVAAVVTVRTTGADRPAVPVRDARPAPHPRSSGAWRVARALGRVEGRRLLCSPLVVAGFVLAPLSVGFGFSETTDLTEHSIYAGLAMLVPAAMTLVAANLAALRSRRHGTEEVLGVAAAAPGARTAGHLLAVAWPTAGAAVLVALMSAAVHLTSETRGDLHLAELVVGPLLVAGAGTLGVLLARWLPSPAAAPAACVAIAVFEFTMNGPRLGASGWRWMAFWVQGAGDLPLGVLPARPAGWHALYLAGLVAAACVGALVRHGARSRVVLAGCLVLAVVAGSAWAQGRPPSAAAWARADARLIAPADHQVCETRDQVRYCAYPPHDGLFGHWAADVGGVLRVVPEAARPGRLEVSQRVVPTIDFAYLSKGLHRRLQRRMPALPALESPLPGDGALHPPVSWDWDGRDGSDLGLAFGAASLAIGLPLAPAAPLTLCDGAGQGRTVVAAWLAGQATAETGAALRRHARPQPGRTHVALWENWEGAVALGTVEVEYALDLLERPAGEVAPLIAAQWEQLTGRDATTAEVAARLGLPVRAVPPAGASRPVFGDDVGSDLRLGPPCA